MTMFCGRNNQIFRKGKTTDSKKTRRGTIMPSASKVRVSSRSAQLQNQWGNPLLILSSTFSRKESILKYSLCPYVVPYEPVKQGTNNVLWENSIGPTLLEIARKFLVGLPKVLNLRRAGLRKPLNMNSGTTRIFSNFGLACPLISLETLTNS